MSNVEAKITVGTTFTREGTTLGFGPISSLEEAWQEEFAREDFGLARGESPDPDDGCWTIVLIGGDGGENLELDLDHPADRVPSISQIVEALDLDLTGPCEVVAELGFVERYGDRGPLQMEVEFRPVPVPVEEETTVVVTRHPALIDYLVETGLVEEGVEVVSHADEASVRGKHVIGVLPLRLAALAQSITEVPLTLPADLRGVELTLDQIREHSGEATTYVVARQEV